jgi:hypothetical protein
MGVNTENATKQDSKRHLIAEFRASAVHNQI